MRIILGQKEIPADIDEEESHNASSKSAGHHFKRHLFGYAPFQSVLKSGKFDNILEIALEYGACRKPKENRIERGNLV
ncbi:hypothetical protein CHS0354_014393 [Potamilus streckersoni]|uniref:Uncharacterized protein n=1 Tax=Potamilus streckersoni TaxID=2493646 RepID=A0AAE0VSE4_9BIVA|nr:hypothetical protein CHS0354_014393 [Potamilus streckersoni]